jgi:hypothetical protein
MDTLESRFASLWVGALRGRGQVGATGGGRVEVAADGLGAWLVCDVRRGLPVLVAMCSEERDHAVPADALRTTLERAGAVVAYH